MVVFIGFRMAYFAVVEDEKPWYSEK